jgi:hypothetical protein
MCSHLSCGFSRRVKFFFYWLCMVLVSVITLTWCGSQSDLTKITKYVFVLSLSKTQHNRVGINIGRVWIRIVCPTWSGRRVLVTVWYLTPLLAIFTYIVAVSLLLEETGVTGENHRRAAGHWQTLFHIVVSTIPRHSPISISQR